MKLHQPQTLQAVAAIINAEFQGNANHLITGFNEIHKVEIGDVVFVDHPKYYDKALLSAATTILINKKVSCPEGKALIFSEDPFRDYNRLTSHFAPYSYSLKNISNTAAIGEDTILMPGVYIGNNVKIGNNCIIHPNVVIYNNTQIGNNVIIHANTVIGSDAFYYKKRANLFDKLVSCGRVVIEDDVELGASCTIDKGVSGDTVIGKGSKLDNQVHIGHDTVIGEMCLLAAQVGVAGASILQNRVTLWGQVGVSSGLTIEEGAVVYAQSGVGKTLKGNKTYFGSPAGEAREKMKDMAMLKQIPFILEKIK